MREQVKLSNSVKLKLKYSDLNFKEDIIIVSSFKKHGGTFNIVFGIDNVHEKTSFSINPVPSKATVSFSMNGRFGDSVYISYGSRSPLDSYLYPSSVYNNIRDDTLFLLSEDIQSKERNRWTSNYPSDYTINENAITEIAEFEKNIESSNYVLVYSITSIAFNEEGLRVYANKSLIKRISSAKYNIDKTRVYISLDSGVNFALPVRYNQVHNISIAEPSSRKMSKEDLEPSFFELEEYSDRHTIKNIRNSNFRKIKLERMESNERFNLLYKLYRDIADGKYIITTWRYCIKKKDFVKIIDNISINGDNVYIAKSGKNSFGSVSKSEFNKLITEIRDLDRSEFDEWRLLMILNNPEINIE